MKIFKIIALFLMISISNSYATETTSYASTSTIEMSSTTDNAKNELQTIQVAEEPMSMEEEFFNVLKTFFSYTLMAFVFCLVCPKFTKKTISVFFETNKFKIIFEGLKVVFITITISSILLFLGIGSSIGIFMLSLLMALFSLGIPMLSIFVLEWIFNKKNIKMDKLSKTNKFISILSVNIILMLISLPFLWLIPAYNINYQGGIIEINLAYQILITLMSLLGIGAAAKHLRDLFDKHRKKL